MTCLRLVLGDQLDATHRWFRHTAPDVIYVLMEVRQETDYVLHHAQKVIAFFACMRRFAAQLADDGHRVEYLAIDASDNRHALSENLDALAQRHGATRIEFQDPDEYRLDRQLHDYAARASVPVVRVATEHFYTERSDARALFGTKSHWLLETFYRHVRSRHGILLDERGKPLGGRWNFDAANRKPWRGRPPEPPDRRPLHDHRTLWDSIRTAGVRTFGDAQAQAFRWPLDRADALAQLRDFVAHALPWFGDYQDAMSASARRLFHSHLSFALNAKLLNPREVVASALEAYAAGHAPLNAVEGYVRQIIGWREFVRGVYWARMPDYVHSNRLGHTRALPSWFWTGRTRMRCLALSIGQSLETAHAHHIQRLMVIGNFALLAGLDPQALHRWYLGVYIDAVEWVEAPNTLGLSQFADGGLLATKPYVSGANYIDRMSDYCAGCPYDRKRRTGARACPFNALYWAFLLRHRATFAPSPRMALPYKHLATWSRDEIAAVTASADAVLDDLESV